jgi:hypothetical protein
MAESRPDGSGQSHRVFWREDAPVPSWGHETSKNCTLYGQRRGNGCRWVLRIRIGGPSLQAERDNIFIQ